MFDVFAKGLISVWLWSIGWGWNQVPINTIMLALLLIFVGRLPIIRSVFCSLFFTLGAFVVLTIKALACSFWLYGAVYVPELWGPVLDSLHVTFYLGFVYTIIQIFLYFFVRKYINSRVPFILFLSNMLTAVIVYQLLPMNVL